MSESMTAARHGLRKGLTGGTCPKCGAKSLRHAPSPAGDVFHCGTCKALPANEAIGHLIGVWPPKTALDRHRIETEMAASGLRWAPADQRAPEPSDAGRLKPEQIDEILKATSPWRGAAPEDIAALRKVGIDGGHPAFYYVRRGKRGPKWFEKESSAKPGTTYDLFQVGNFRLIFVLYDENGTPRGLKLRPLPLDEPYNKTWTAEELKSRKTYTASGSTHGLILACDRVVAALQGNGAWPPYLVVLEGEKDLAAAITRWSRVHRDVGFVALFSGAVSRAWVEKIPATTRIVSMVDPDRGGEAYHRELVAVVDALGQHEIARLAPNLWYAFASPEVVAKYDPKSPPDVADAIVDRCAPDTLDLASLFDLRPDPYSASDLLRLSLERDRRFRHNPHTDTLLFAKSARADDADAEFVARPVPLITHEARDILTREVVVEIGWGREEEGETFHDKHRIGGDLLADPRVLARTLSKQKLNISPGQQSTLGAWFALQRLVGDTLIPQVISARANGWWNPRARERHAEGGGFLLGGQWIQAAPTSSERVYRDDTSMRPSAAKIAAAQRPAEGGSFVGWCSGMEVIRAYPVPQVFVLGALASVLLSRLETRAVMVGSIFPPKTAKTLALQVGLSTYARPGEQDGALLQWGASIPGLEDALNYLRHLPVCLDDTSQIKAEGRTAQERSDSIAQKIASIAFMVVNGTERVLAKDGGGAPGGWRMMALYTAEVRPDMRGQQEGAKKRMMALTCHPWQRMPSRTDPHPPILGEKSDLPHADLTRIADTAAQHAGHVMPAFLREVLRHPVSGLRARWRAMADDYRAQLRGKVRFDDTAAEIAATLALAQQIFETACAHEKIRPDACPVRKEVVSWFVAHLIRQREADGSDDHASQTFSAFREWALSSRNERGPWMIPDLKMMPRETEIFGLWETTRHQDVDDEGREISIYEPGDLYIQSSALSAFLKRNPSPRSADDIVRSWIAAGYIEVPATYTETSHLNAARWPKYMPGPGTRKMFKVPGSRFRD